MDHQAVGFAGHRGEREFVDGREVDGVVAVTGGDRHRDDVCGQDGEVAVGQLTKADGFDGAERCLDDDRGGHVVGGEFEVTGTGIEIPEQGQQRPVFEPFGCGGGG